MVFQWDNRGTCFGGQIVRRSLDLRLYSTPNAAQQVFFHLREGVADDVPE